MTDAILKRDEVEKVRLPDFKTYYKAAVMQAVW